LHKSTKTIAVLKISTNYQKRLKKNYQVKAFW